MENNTKSKTKAEVHPLNKWIQDNTLFVTKLRIQMTSEQCDEILAEFPDRKLIMQTLGEMDNYKPLTRRYNSVFLTLRNWLRRNIDLFDNPPAAAAGVKRRNNGWTCTYAEAITYLERKGISPAELTNQFEMQPAANPDQKPLWRKR